MNAGESLGVSYFFDPNARSALLIFGILNSGAPFNPTFRVQRLDVQAAI